jgi:monofunctional biosynthetic peptidoglycan transglycosylase
MQGRQGVGDLVSIASLGQGKRRRLDELEAEPESDAEPPATPQPVNPVAVAEAARDFQTGIEPEPAAIAPPAPISEPAPAPPPFRSEPPRPARRRGGLGRLVGRAALLAIAFAVIAPPLGVMFYKLVPPPFTILMLERLVQGQGLDYQWRPLSQMAPALPQAAIASEDAHFCQHHGFDFQAMEKALRQNQRQAARGRDKVRGGSTISQQTAKNVFLWPGRSYVRKGAEAVYTVLIEKVWGKRRIMEMYLNVAEMGPGVYGAEAASQYYFHEAADQLSPDQAAHLIAVLPSPLKWKVTAPGRYVARRSRRIDGAMGTVREDGLASCLRDD